MSALVNWYHAQANEANSRVPTNLAQGRLIGAQADAAPGQSQSEQSLRAAQAGLLTQQAAVTQPNAQSEAALRAAQSGLLNQQATALPQTAASDLATAALARQQQSQNLAPDFTGFGGLPHFALGTPDVGGMLPSVTDAGTGGIAPLDPDVPVEHFAAGGQVPGHQSGPPVDTVPAMLSPGEAVLNRGAAEHVGRGVIAHLNQIGLMKMQPGGQPPGTMPPAQAGAAPAPQGQRPQPQGKPSPQGKGDTKAKAGGGGKEQTSKGNKPAPTDSRSPTVQHFADGGMVGLGDGGVLQGTNPFTGRGIMSDLGSLASSLFTPRAAAPSVPAVAPAASIAQYGVTPPNTPAGAGYGGGMVPHFLAGTEEVLPWLSYMTGMDQNAINGQDENVTREANATTKGAATGGMPKGYAKGTAKVPASKASKSMAATPQPPTMPQAAPPAMTAMPQTSIPQMPMTPFA